MYAVEGAVTVGTGTCAAVAAATAADRLFDDFVILAMVGVAVCIALFVMKAFGKLFKGMVN